MAQSLQQQLLISTFPPIHFFALEEVDIIDLSSQRLGTTIECIEKDGSTKDEEEKFVDDVEFESNEDSPQLLD